MPKKNIMTAAPAKTPPPAQLTEADLFILESLRFEDESAGRFEGKMIANILNACGKKPIYYYFRTVDELMAFSGIFRASGYRFLHLSCHGTIDTIHMTLGDVSIERFGDIFAGKLKNRRLFVSACLVGSGRMPQLVSERNRGMYSIACPMDEIRFDRAAAIWATFYVKMFDGGKIFLKNEKLKESLKNLCSLFDVRFRWANHNTVSDSWDKEVIPGE